MESVFHKGIDSGLHRNRPIVQTTNSSMEYVRLVAERVSLILVILYRVLDGVRQHQAPIKNALAQNVSVWDRESHSGDGDPHGGPSAVATPESALLAGMEPGITYLPHSRDMTDMVPIPADRGGTPR